MKKISTIIVCCMTTIACMAIPQSKGLSPDEKTPLVISNGKDKVIVSLKELSKIPTSDIRDLRVGKDTMFVVIPDSTFQKVKASLPKKESIRKKK